MQPDVALSIRFLRLLAPRGPWVLTRISPDRQRIKTSTFHPGNEDTMRSWILEAVEDFNIYFMVNPPMADITKKATREAVREMALLHVDVDPKNGQDLGSEHRRIEAMMTTNLPPSVPPPTFVIFSGGGYQAFWRLETPQPINGDLAVAEELKLYNMQLEILFGGDNCHNIDRIMRLPGTINIPDDKKKAKGRSRALARLVVENENVYPISRFTKATRVGSTTDEEREVQISGNVQRLRDIDELDQWQVPGRVKMVIVQGSDPDNPKKGDNSRSAWLFDVICQLHRCGVPDEVIYAVVTDPDFRIADSVIEKGNHAENYARRQIARAKPYTIDQDLGKLNEEYAVIQDYGGKCVVVHETTNELGLRILSRQGFEDFRNIFMNQLKVVETKDGPKSIPLGHWWLKHPQRRQYRSIVFEPERITKGDYNLWQGWAVDAIPGDCQIYLDFVRTIVCNGVDDHYNYLLKWMAWAVQNPAKAGQVAVVLQGVRGAGKGTFVEIFGHLFGSHFMQVADERHMTGNFNIHLRDCVLLYADEAFYAGNKKHESVLKTLISEPRLAIEAKYSNVEMSRNCLHIIMASNDDWVVPAGPLERRFLMLKVSGEKRGDTEYFGELRKKMLEEGGCSALLHMLKNMDLSRFNIFDAPQTQALQQQQILSMSPTDSWWHEKLTTGAILDKPWIGWVASSTMYLDYQLWCDSNRIYRKLSPIALALYLKKMMPDMENQKRAGLIYERKLVDGTMKYTSNHKQGVRGLKLPDLETARRTFNDYMSGSNGVALTWEDTDTDLQQENEENVPF